MPDELTGFQFFPRRPEGGPPVAITLNMDLRAQATAASRPWACRTSVRLLKPGPDGVIHDADEIERVGQLGIELSDRLNGGSETGFAGMYTSAGVRTWLNYCRTPEPTLFGDRTSESIVETAKSVFAGQSDYVPVVRVDLDPDWRVYASLYPTLAEQEGIRFQNLIKIDRARAKAMSAATAKMLMKRGDDLTQPRDIDFALFFPSSAARAMFAELAETNGFKAHVPAAETDGSSETRFSITVVRQEPVLPGRMAQLEDWLIVRARRAGGIYDGWGCLWKKPKQEG